MKALPFSRSALAAAMAATFFCGTSSAATPVSPEFRANTYTTDSQDHPSVAIDADGDFVVSWHSYEQDADNYGFSDGVYAQRYDAAGIKQGKEFRVNTFTYSQQGEPRVAMSANGDFVISWTSFGEDGPDNGVYAQRYNAAGVKSRREFRVNSYTTDQQSSPCVAMDADGDFVISWQSLKQDGSDYGIYAKRYDAAGSAQGGEFRVNSFASGSQFFPTVAMDADGDFVVSWVSNGQDGSGHGIYAQRYNAAGVAQGIDFRVNSFTTNNQSFPSVAMSAGGDFVVSWQSNQQDGSSYGIYAQRYNAAGVAQGNEFRVNSFTTGNQSSPSVAVDAAGDFVISWQSSQQDGSSIGVYAQRYNAAGLKQGGEFRINTYTTSSQAATSIAMDADGDFVVGWQSNKQDGSGYGVYARRYQGFEPIDLTLTQFDSADPVDRGKSLFYTLMVANLNPPSAPVTGIPAIDKAIGAASDVRIIGTLPRGSIFKSSSNAGWSCSLPSRKLTCRPEGTLPAGASAPPLTINLTAPNKTGMIRHDARVSGAQNDPLPSNNRDIETTQVINAPP